MDPSTIAARKDLPPLATDPSRLTGQQTDDLLEAWDTESKGGLELSVDEQATVYACPTEASSKFSSKSLRRTRHIPS